MFHFYVLQAWQLDVLVGGHMKENKVESTVETTISLLNFKTCDQWINNEHSKGV